MWDVTAAKKTGMRRGMGLYDDSMAWLRAKVESEGKTALARRLGVPDNTFTRWFAKPDSTNYREPNWRTVSEVFDKMGVGLMLPETTAGRAQTRDVAFINPKIVGIENGAPPPSSEDYLAVPLAEEAIAAGPGLMPSDELRGWVLVWRHHDSVRFLHDLVAVEIGKGQTSMVPFLYPGDIVLVNKEDRNPSPAGKIMLVCDPDGGCAIKRVSSRRIDGDVELVFYSDNAQEHPPRVHRLNRDYGGNIDAAIGGRVVWAWSDMTRK